MFSQSSPPKAIQLDNQDGVFITIDLMDSISLKLIDRTILQKENLTFAKTLLNVRAQNEQLAFKFDLASTKAVKYKNLWGIAENQKDLYFDSLEKQRTITSNIKKKPLETIFYTSEGASRSVWSPLLC